MKLNHQTLLFVHVIFIPCDNRLGVIFQGEDSSIYVVKRYGAFNCVPKWNTNFQKYGHGYFVFVLIELRTVVQIKVVNIVGCSKLTFVASLCK